MRHCIVVVSVSTVALLLAGTPGSFAAGNVEKVTFTRDVAPIFMNNCVTCHRPGEVAPMSLLTYEEARPWAKSIKKKVASGEMPPWRVDPRYGKFANDMRLTQQEIDTIATWVDQNAPMGNPQDMPEAPEFHDGWKLGEPDFVIELPTTHVPAAGDDLFPNQLVQIDMPDDRWVRAIEFLPGDRRVVHHVLALLGDFGMSSGDEDRERRGGTQAEVFSVWVAGSQPTVYPEGMGRVVRKNQMITFNMHYHPFGEAVTDTTRVGLFFSHGDLEKRITTTFAVNTGFRIPPGVDNYEVRAHYLFDQDSSIISFLPHMHVRGKDMTYTALYPDGRRQTLLSVPAYDYNWQWIYYPEEHIRVPAGTRVEVVAHYDNSDNNAANPDPDATVYYRDITVQEMLVGFFEFVVEDGEAPRPPAPREKITKLLAEHPADASYVADGLFGLPWGLYLPREGEGRWYLSIGNAMFTNSVLDIEWNGNAFSFFSGMVTQGGGGISMNVEAKRKEDGTITGEIRLGELEAAQGQPGVEVAVLPFTAQPVAMSLASAR